MASQAGALRAGFAASLLLHLFALAALLALVRARPLPFAAETSIDVEILLPTDIPAAPEPLIPQSSEPGAVGFPAG